MLRQSFSVSVKDDPAEEKFPALPRYWNRFHGNGQLFLNKWI
jgi:hypothetical protein